MKHKVVNIIGREEEKHRLASCLESNRSEFIAIYGRRRVGKTYLIENFFASRICFHLTGLQNATLKQQLQNFSLAYSSGFKLKPVSDIPAGWMMAFELLKLRIQTMQGKGKKVLFLDELPWLDTPRSGFLQALDNFWNTWASKRKDIVLVICGSAASWIIQKVVNNKGGLHNRLTERIRLLPFTLGETKLYLQHRKIKLNTYHLLQLYMCMGGIPEYLNKIKPGKSATQIIDSLCFSKDGFLKHEFNNLYSSLFNSAERHIQIIKVLASHPQGLNRKQLLNFTSFNSGGNLSAIMNELSESGFISEHQPLYKKSKDTIYRLADEYSLFYLKFIAPNTTSGPGSWNRLSLSNSHKVWCGYAFEGICIKHINQIKQALGINGIHSETASWHLAGNKNQQGVQIDLLIDRADNCINICEIKYYAGIFVINKKYASELEQKMRIFSTNSKTRKTLFLTVISTYGVQKNEYAINSVSNTVEMDSLFL